MRIDVLLPESTQTLLVPESDRRSLAQILRSYSLPLNTRCGERDMCAGCIVEVVAGAVENLASGETAPLESEFRGCQHRPRGDVTIRIPERSRLSYAPKVLDSYRVNVPYAHDPLASAGLGVAIDIGTTTVAVEIWDLARGEVVGKSSGFNKQMHFGDDVLTRINLCSTDPTMVSQLQSAIIQETLNPLIVEAVGSRPLGDVACLTVAGNTTMLHLFLGEDPSPMGTAPFTPRFLEHPPVAAGRVGLEPGEAIVYVLPGISAYVGADLTAGLFASGLLYESGTSLLVDVGTNGEILLAHEGRVLACATAAGPAFEGSGLTSGIRAGNGAISRIQMHPESGEVAFEKIGSVRPMGLCGSAYVDFLAEGRRTGFLGATGRFEQGFDPLISSSGHGRLLRIAYGQGKRPIGISEGDVARLLQAKAAIAAGILTLLNRAKVAPDMVETLYLAGGFGMHLDLDHAIASGLLPGFRQEQIQLVGNTSLAGAAISLLDKSVLSELDRATKNVEIVELNLEASFEDTYLDQLSLP